MNAFEDIECEGCNEPNPLVQVSVTIHVEVDRAEWNSDLEINTRALRRALMEQAKMITGKENVWASHVELLG